MLPSFNTAGPLLAAGAVLAALVGLGCGDSFTGVRRQGAQGGSGAGAAGAGAGASGGAGQGGEGGAAASCGDGKRQDGEVCLGTPVTYPSGAADLSSLALADCDGDGDLDVLGVHKDTPGLFVLRGDGKGGLGAPKMAPLDANPAWVAAGDVDGDGDVDAAVAYAGSEDFLTVVDSGGDCGFKQSSKLTYMMGATVVRGVVMADLNGDAKDEVVASADEFLKFWVGGSAWDKNVGPAVPGALAAAKFDGDMDVDVAFVRPEGASATVAHSSGSGFDALYDGATGPSPRPVAAGDLDGDGDTDLAVGLAGAAVSVLLSDPSGTALTAVLPDAPASVAAEQVALGDLDGDFLLDVVLSGTAALVEVLRGEGLGKLSPAAKATLTHGGKALGVGDLNGDGLPDVVVGGGGSISVLVTAP